MGGLVEAEAEGKHAEVRCCTRQAWVALLVQRALLGVGDLTERRCLHAFELPPITTNMRREYQHPSLAPFALLAERLCRAIENANALEPGPQLVQIHRLLARAHAAALDLPPTSVLFDEEDESEDDDEDDRDEVAIEERRLAWSKTLTVSFDSLAAHLGLRRYYQEAFDPHAEKPDGVGCGDLFDDFRDIHADLSRGLFHWARGNGGLALWEWRFGLENHWGEHATSALRALFALCAWNGFVWPSREG